MTTVLVTLELGLFVCADSLMTTMMTHRFRRPLVLLAMFLLIALPSSAAVLLFLLPA